MDMEIRSNVGPTVDVVDRNYPFLLRINIVLFSMQNNQQSSRGRGGVDGAPPSYGPSGSKRRRRDFDAEDEFSGGRGGEWGAGGGRGDTEFKRRQSN